MKISVLNFRVLTETYFMKKSFISNNEGLKWLFLLFPLHFSTPEGSSFGPTKILKFLSSSVNTSGLGISIKQKLAIQKLIIKSF